MIAAEDIDTAEQEAARLRRAFNREAEVMIDALRRTRAMRGEAARWLRELEARIVHEGITPDERFHLRRLAWFHRRSLPSHLAPRLNPGDPIVMAMELEGEAAHG